MLYPDSYITIEIAVRIVEKFLFNDIIGGAANSCSAYAPFLFLGGIWQEVTHKQKETSKWREIACFRWRVIINVLVNLKACATENGDFGRINKT